MQIFGPRTSSSGTVYSAAQITQQLTAPALVERWAFYHLDQTGSRVNDAKLGDLTSYVDKKRVPVITHDTAQAVRRHLSLRLIGNNPLYVNDVPLLNHQIAVYYRLQMAAGDFVDFALGRFVILPQGGETSSAIDYEDVTAYDYGQLLLDYSFQQSAAVGAGVSAVAAAKSLLSIPGAPITLTANIPDLGRVLNQPIAWDPGTSRLKAINDCLSAVNYFPAWFDENGVMRSSPIPDWNTVTPSYTFDSTAPGGIMLTPFTRTVDWSQAGNIQTVYVEDPRRTAFSATYTNDNPLSPVSTKRWHPKTLPPIKDSTIPDYATAWLIARHNCQLAARLYQSVTVDTTTWPLSQDTDIYGVKFTNPDDGLKSFNVVESAWAMQCSPGGKTTHTIQQLVAA